ncbi:MAG: alpha/beta hydrolase family protein [Pyrinomonadaceae bacterium]
MKHALTIAVCLLCFFLETAHAQQSGTYTTYVAGKAAVVDQWTATTEKDGTLKTEAALGAPGAVAAQRAVTVAVNHRPISFTLLAGENKLIAADFNGATVKLRIQNQPERELPTKATMVLENLLWHQFVFLLDQYDEVKGGQQSFVALLPSQAIDYPITVERVGTPDYQAAGKTIKTRRYHLVANNALMLDMWTDEARVPLLFFSAAQQLKVVRQGAEGLAEAALANAPKPAEYQPPSYAAPALFREQQVTVGAGSEWALPATLTVPTGDGPFPAIVLVHGSGPNDRDETLGPNKPFQDVAWGLASQGIAVLRYDKRTLVHKGKVVALPNFSVKEETVDDAIAAVALLRETQGVDPKRIFVLGHSLGGMLVPRIGLADKSGIAGFIIFAGATRPLEDEWVRQFEYIYGLDGQITPTERAEIDGYKQQVMRVKQLTPADAARNNKELLLYVPPSYWLDLRGYSPPAVALQLKQPLLILQGERDYNVTMDAFRDWQQALGKRADVSFKSYPKLDHLFFEGAGPASAADYARPRNIPKYVVDDIAGWIKKQR